MTARLGAVVADGVTRFAVRAPLADSVELCLFRGAAETRHPLAREGDIWSVDIAANLAGAAYGYRAYGEYAPERGLWFDPAKLLVDP